ncbi:protein lethal(2)essential for life-like [Schistocerca serialis cubense]|uniref:protein lethal(2)essential for life-like n=1 Tax=Schistocerca serialis cubense TaxID=2023355 RepID=UPI00214EC5E2|nr:protein lethal(2)essential for life-like [Schistocerca serialis cubense]
MALTPLISHLLEDVDRQMSLFDQNFGLGLTHDDLLLPRLSIVPSLSGYYRPWRHLAARNSGVSTIQNNKDGFKVNLDVQQFKPEELTVKVVGDSVVVEAKHEERKDEHGYISRQMQRRYLLPKDVVTDQVQTQLSSDGVLTISAPKKALPAAEGSERVVQIVQTGVPAVTNQQQQGGEKMEQ